MEVRQFGNRRLDTWFYRAQFFFAPLISKCFETILDISGPHSGPMPQVAYPDASDGVFMCLGGIAESSLPAGAKLSH